MDGPEEFHPQRSSFLNVPSIAILSLYIDALGLP